MTTSPAATPSGWDASTSSSASRSASSRTSTATASGGGERQEAYRCDVTYGTNNEFGFDYLRDNMKFDLEAMVQRDPVYAIVDEGDALLIDEARTPTITSGPSEESVD